MGTLITVFVLVALFHYVYESILAPSFRLELRYELFKLRDALRDLKMEREKEFSDKHFSYLQDSINTMIANLARWDIATMVAATIAVERDEHFKKRVEERSKALDDCHLQEAKEIRKKSLILVSKAVVVNNGAWTIFLLLPAVAYHFYDGARRYIRSSVRSVASMSEGEFNKVALGPPDSLFAHNGQ